MWFGRAGADAVAMHKFMEFKMQQDLLQVPEWVVIHVGINDIKGPTGTTSCRKFVEIVAEHVIKVLNVVHNLLAGKPGYKGVVFSQILPVIHYKTFQE